jgi:RNA polymerase sigma factor (sigma-70 family)
MLTDFVRHLQRVTRHPPAPDLTDGELLERFRAHREEAAFAVLLQRHGPMVLGVCRRVLGNDDLAEDAFQATFLVLVRKAPSIRKRQSVASWLYGVARRTSLKARLQETRHRSEPLRLADLPAVAAPDELTLRELRAILDEELAQLPEKYRVPLVLCYLEGKTHEQAAHELGWPRTSLSTRLGRARLLLQRRLTRRGLALSLGLLGALLGAEASGSPVSALLLISTTQAAGLVAAGKAAAGVVSSQAAALAEGVARAMFVSQLKVGLVLLLVLGLFVTGAGLVGHHALAARPPAATAEQADPPAEPPKERGPGDFVDVTRSCGIDFTYHNGEESGQYAILESLGGGVALLDYDGDGLLDIFIIGGGFFDGPNKQQIKGHPCGLYRNLGGGKFQDVTREAGIVGLPFYSHGCAVADYDADGWPDLLVTGYGGLALFHNESDGKGGRRFVLVTDKAGLGRADGWWTSAAWADLDGDGYPDLYICNYVNWSPANNPLCTYDGKTRDLCPPKQFQARPHALFHNNGDGTFTDVAKKAGLRVPREDKDYEKLTHFGPAAREALRQADREKDYGKGRGVVIADVDNDGKPDIFVTNDTTGNFLYLNRSRPGEIRLEEIALQAGVARDDRGSPTGSAGVDFGDYDNSGRPSLLIANYEGEQMGLYQGAPGGIFRLVSHRAGLAAGGQSFTGWGAGFLDWDNDGRLDLFVATGSFLRFPPGKAGRGQRPVLFRNAGDGRFEAVDTTGWVYFGADHLARGVAFGDFDNDGRVDLVISHLNEPVAVLRNEAQGEANHWLGVELRGKDHHDVVGARVVVTVDGREQTRHVRGGGSYLSAHDPRLVFGLGKADRVGKVTIVWPLGKEQEWQGEKLAIDRYWILTEGKDTAEERRR